MLPGPRPSGPCKYCKESGSQCDQKKPRCSECVAKKKACGGYDMGHIFINVNSAAPPPTWNRSQNAQKYLVLDMASQPGTSPQSQPSSSAAPVPSNLGPPNPAGSKSVDALASSLAGKDNKNYLQNMVELCLGLYYRQQGPGDATIASLVAGNESGGWRLLLPRWLGQSPLLDTAIQALALSFIGTQYKDENYVYQARNVYLSALQMVQQALHEPNSTARKDLLATTLVMSSTELFMSNGAGPSQRTHIEGATRLLKSSLGCMDFEEIHVYILNQGLFEAITSRRRYLFSSPSLKKFAHQIYSVPRTSGNDLYFQWCELVLPLPDLLSTTDGIVYSAPPSPAPTVLAVVEDLTALEQSALAWYELLKSSGSGPWTFSAAQSNDDSVAFPLQFISIEACANYCLYWASRLLMLEARQSLYLRLRPSEVPEHPDPSALAPQISEYASLICRSVQFCTHNTSFAATENMFLPLDIVTGYYMRQGDQERMKWCVGAFARISQEHNIGYAVDKLDLVNMSPARGSCDPVGVWDEI